MHSIDFVFVIFIASAQHKNTYATKRSVTFANRNCLIRLCDCVNAVNSFSDRKTVQ